MSGPVGQRAALAILALAAVAAPVLAAPSPFGVAVPEPAAGGLLPWIAGLQAQWYRELTGALKLLREDSYALWWLGGLSFGYGVVHAAGPGHGKVVISSYLLANEEAARRGITIAFCAAMVQAIVAVTLVGVAAAALNMTSFAISGTARLLEIGSYGLIAALGLTLVWRKAGAVWRAMTGARHAHTHSCGVQAASSPAAIGCCSGHHLPQAAAATGRGAAAAILSVGIRPCTGALIVLVFALAQGLFWAGVASTFLMAMGTGLTIALLASVAVGAKGLAARLADRNSRRAEWIMLAVELCGALLVTAFGLALLAAALAG